MSAREKQSQPSVRFQQSGEVRISLRSSVEQKGTSLSCSKHAFHVLRLILICTKAATKTIITTGYGSAIVLCQEGAETNKQTNRRAIKNLERNRTVYKLL